jgi:hypothetical protein
LHTKCWFSAFDIKDLIKISLLCRYHWKRG